MVAGGRRNKDDRKQNTLAPLESPSYATYVKVCSFFLHKILLLDISCYGSIYFMFFSHKWLLLKGPCCGLLFCRMTQHLRALALSAWNPSLLWGEGALGRGSYQTDSQSQPTPYPPPSLSETTKKYFTWITFNIYFNVWVCTMCLVHKNKYDIQDFGENLTTPQSHNMFLCAAAIKSAWKL